MEAPKILPPSGPIGKRPSGHMKPAFQESTGGRKLEPPQPSRGSQMIRNIGKVATFVVLGASAAGAQQKPFTIEVGADAAFSVVSETFGTTTENTTTLSVPV